jgi:hypothetical protein
MTEFKVGDLVRVVDGNAERLPQNALAIVTRIHGDAWGDTYVEVLLEGKTEPTEGWLPSRFELVSSIDDLQAEVDEHEIDEEYVVVGDDDRVHAWHEDLYAAISDAKSAAEETGGDFHVYALVASAVSTHSVEII